MLAGVASAAPAQAAGGALGGYTGSATATPLRVEVHEQAIPVPADPELELDLLYTRVSGDSGPTSAAVGSALWPGDAIGQGLPALGTQLHLPSQLTGAGYPLQADAASPAGPAQASQEPLPGLVTTVHASQTGATAQANLGSPPADATASDGPSPTASTTPSPTATPSGVQGTVTGLLNGLGLGSLTTSLTSLASASPGSAPGVSSLPNVPNPLGALSALVTVGAATSTSTTAFATDSLTNKSVAKLADVTILGGLIHLESVTVSATSQATLDGAKDTPKVTYAGLTVAGQPFQVNSDGLVAAGSSVPLAGLGIDPGKLLASLGITLKLAPVQDQVDGSSGTLEVRGPELTIDTTTLRAKLPTLPLAGLLAKVPSSAEQLVSLLLALNEAHPKVVVALGDATATTSAVAPLVFGGPDAAGAASTPSANAATGSTSSPAASGPAAVTPALPAAPGGGVVPTVAAPATQTAALQPTAAAPGLPPLGSLPGLLLYGGLVLAGAAGWWVRRAGLLVLGGGATCPHGLRSGLPDLRKVSS